MGFASNHVLSVSMGVEVIANGAQAIVTIFEGGRFETPVILALAEEALKVSPHTGFDRWTGSKVWYTPDPTDYTVKVQFVKIKEK